jgi:hypothetical protein
METDMGKALEYAARLLSELPVLIQAGSNVLDIIQHGNAKIQQFISEKRDPTDLEWEELNNSMDVKRQELHDVRTDLGKL